MAGNDFQARKVVTFGDPSAARGGWGWSVLSILLVFFLWCYFTAYLPKPVLDGLAALPAPIEKVVSPEGKQPFWLPNPAETWNKFIELTQNGYRNAKGINPYPFLVNIYWEPAREAIVWLPEGLKQVIFPENFVIPILHGHLWDSFYRILMGFLLGCLVGIPLGISMALSKVMKGLFDPIIEMYRPVPPLAWAPLIIVILGIDEDGKIVLLFMAALSIMVIAARAGASGVNLSKIHAAYSLGATKFQILKNVILPNSMPEILTGMRVAMGVCWGTVVAAEMIGGISGIGFSVNFARKFFSFDIIWSGIILMGLIGWLIDLMMRVLIEWLTPWRGKV